MQPIANLPVTIFTRHEPVRRMATAGLGRGAVDHPVRTVTEYPGARDFRQEKAFIILSAALAALMKREKS